MSRRSRAIEAAIKAHDERLIDVYGKLVHYMLGERRKGINPSYRGTIFSSDAVGCTYDLWDTLKRAAVSESLTLFDAECDSYAERLAERQEELLAKLAAIPAAQTDETVPS